MDEILEKDMDTGKLIKLTIDYTPASQVKLLCSPFYPRNFLLKMQKSPPSLIGAYSEVPKRFNDMIFGTV